MSIRVHLSPAQVAYCLDIAERRVATAKGKARFTYGSTGRSAVTTHHYGAMGEAAFCVATGRVIALRVGTYRSEPDLDPCWEIRWSSDPKHVKVATDDPPDYLVTHVTGKPPIFDVHGYVLAGYVQSHYPAVDLGNRGRPAHFAPTSVLAPLNPGVHSSHDWFRWRGEWACLHCPGTYS